MLEATVKEQLKNVRASLGLPQRKLARLAGVSAMVVSNAEKGYPIRRLSAFALLEVINDHRKERNLPTMGIDDIDWVIGR